MSETEDFQNTDCEKEKTKTSKKSNSCALSQFYPEKYMATEVRNYNVQI